MPAGRPSKFNPQVQVKICRALRNGHYLETAARLAGICYDTLREWVKRGEGGDPEFSEFAADIKKAIASSESELLQQIFEAARDKSTWQAGAWILERRFPDRWGKQRSDAAQAQQAMGRYLDEILDRVSPTAKAEFERAAIERRDGTLPATANGSTH